MRYILALFVLLVGPWLGSPPALAQEPVEAKDAFTGRQADLVELAGHLGTLHHLRRLCAQTGNLDLFRDRMRALTALEAPMQSTKRDMQTAFDDSYRDAGTTHLACGEEALSALEAEAKAALVVTERLYAPFR